MTRSVCGLALVATGTAACAGGLDETGPASPAVPSSTSGATSGTPASAPPARSTDARSSVTPTPDRANLVIVTFAVDWQPEPELSTAEVAAQRDRIVAAQQAVLDALGPDGRLVRELHATAQASLAVSDEGLARLDALPEVAAVDDDTPDSADSAG